MTIQTIKRIFVWELPVRIYHWINALAIVALCITGYFIGNPPAIMSNDEASFRYLFGWIRYLHFAAAYIFIFNTLFRVYWAFVGNKYARWNNFIPTSGKFIRELWEVVMKDILMIKKGAYHSIGHNPLAGFIYFLTFVAFLVQTVTGFGLYADNSTWWFPKLFAWAQGLAGGDFLLRNIHHSVMWFFIIFIMIHVYLVFYHDYVEGNGEISSMGGGYKFITSDDHHHESEEDIAA